MIVDNGDHEFFLWGWVICNTWHEKNSQTEFPGIQDTWI